jgi:ferric-dicitrate binding protein FerR (iron transport regulator)
MSDIAETTSDADLWALIQAYCNDCLSADEWEQLERRLLQDAGARAFFRRCLALDAALRDYGESSAAAWMYAEVQRPLPMPLATPRFAATGLPVAALVSLVSLAVVAAVAVFVVYMRMRADASVAATVKQVAGDVRILSAGGQVRTITSDAVLHSGDTVRTRGAQSSTVITYTDGTRIRLVGDTSATCGDKRTKSLVIHHGTLDASVRPQPAGAPLVVATPTAQVQVLGTRFLIDAAAHRTDLRVSEGLVRLVRVSDGSSVQVSHGKQAIVTERDEVLVEDIPDLSPMWSIDFEHGVPPEWVIGEFVTEDLPPGSRGAAQAQRDQGADGVVFGIASHSEWSRGLFAVTSDSHLHMTYKMENPDWLNLFLVTRTREPQELRFAGNFLFKEFPKIPAGRWHTVTIPLAAFRQLPPGTEPLLKVTPFHVILNSTAPDRGLVIDRIWVTPDGPGEVMIRELD